MTTPQLLKPAQVADLLGVSARKVYALASAGELASYRIGAAVRFALSDVEEYKARCRSPATPARAAGCTSLTVSSPDSASALTSYFQRAGRGHRRKRAKAIENGQFDAETGEILEAA